MLRLFAPSDHDPLTVAAGVSPAFFLSAARHGCLYRLKMTKRILVLIAGIARNSVEFFASIPIISLWNISMPAAQSMMTHRVSEREQGELQGALQSMRSITFIIGPWLFLRVFSWFIDPKYALNLPGAPYYLASALLFAAMLMSTRIKQDAPAASRSTSIPPPPDVVPPESIPSGPIAPITGPKENI